MENNEAIAAEKLKSSAIEEATKLKETADNVATRLKETADIVANFSFENAASQLITIATVEAKKLKDIAELAASKLKHNAELSTIESANLRDIAETAAGKLKGIAEVAALNLKGIAEVAAGKLKDRQRQKEVYEAILNSIPNGIYVIDTNKNVLFYNKEIVALLGPQNPTEELENRFKDYGFYLPDQKTPWTIDQQPLIRVINSGQMNGGIMFVRNKSKPEGVWITNYAYPLRNTSGIMVGVVSVLKEIANASSQGLPTLGLDVPPLPL
jgi:PAS domain-containing protein